MQAMCAAQKLRRKIPAGANKDGADKINMRWTAAQIVNVHAFIFTSERVCA